MRTASILTLLTVAAMAMPAAADRLDEQVRAVRDAEEPSAAIAAFAEGMTLGSRSAELHDAYVRKMVELGAPDLASEQARKLTELDPDNGLAWAVVSIAESRDEEDLPAAIYAMQKAVRRDPEDLFVQSSAGQLLAWYDKQPVEVRIPEKARLATLEIRQTLDDSEAFREGYKLAAEAIEEARAAEQTGQQPQAESTRDTIYSTEPDETSVSVVYRSYVVGSPYYGYGSYPYGHYSYGYSPHYSSWPYVYVVPRTCGFVYARPWLFGYRSHHGHKSHRSRRDHGRYDHRSGGVYFGSGSSRDRDRQDFGRRDGFDRGDRDLRDGRRSDSRRSFSTTPGLIPAPSTQIPAPRVTVPSPGDTAGRIRTRTRQPVRSEIDSRIRAERSARSRRSTRVERQAKPIRTETKAPDQSVTETVRETIRARRAARNSRRSRD